MKKPIPGDFFLLVLVLSFLLSSCSSTPRENKSISEGPTPTPNETQPPNPQDENPAITPNERVEIRWFIGVGSGRTPDAISKAKEFAKKFNTSQEKIELVVEVNTISTHDAVDQLLAEIKAGNPPDIVTPANMSWSGEQLFDYLLPLDKYLTEYDLSSIDTATLDSWRVNGELMGLPTGSFSSVIYYNKKLFDAAKLPYPPHKFGEPYADGDPWTIDKMESLAMQLTLDANGRNATAPDFDPKLVCQWGFHWQWDSTRSMVVMFGAGNVVDQDGNAVIPQQWRDGFKWYYDGIWQKYFIPPLTRVNGTVLQGNPFYSGKVAMINYFTFYSSRLNGVPGSISGPDWDIAAVPAYNGKITTRLERNGIIILNTTQHPAEAVEVSYSIATNPELLLVWEMLPAFEDLQPLFLQQLAAKHPGVDWQVMIDSMNYADTTYEKTMPNYRKSYDRLLAFRDSMGMDGKLSMNDEIDKLANDLQMLFEQAR